MAHRASAPTVAAVVAAHNEETRIGQVLETLVTYPGFDEVVVVDDGSDDATADVARSYGVTCVRLATNRGKGAALEAGISHAGTDVVFLADADILELDHATIGTLLEPVRTGEIDMFVAMRHRSIYHARSVLRFLPLLGGERAVSAKLWHAVPGRYKHRFKIEAALNFYAVHYGRGLRYRVFPITQVPKEYKYGLVRGFARRLRMGANVAVAIAEVQANEAPPEARGRRRAALLTALASAGLLLSGRRLALDGPPAVSGSRRAGAVGLALLSGTVVAGQLTRLAQSQARANG